jgi:hypothetical protein
MRCYKCGKEVPTFFGGKGKSVGSMFHPEDGNNVVSHPDDNSLHRQCHKNLRFMAFPPFIYVFLPLNTQK